MSAQHRSRAAVSVWGLIVLCGVAAIVVPGAAAEQASAPASPAAGGLDAGAYHSCAVLAGASLRCWGFGGDGRLGYGNTDTVGDDEIPAAAGPADFDGHAVTAISAGTFHTCGLLDDNSVRCWGSSRNGQLGYATIDSVGDNESPGSAGPVDLGAGHTAKAITAGDYHTCAVRDDDKVLCWGFAGARALGYDSQIPNDNVGDDETPGFRGPVDLGQDGTGQPLTAKAISAGGSHTCAILNDDTVRCWGSGTYGQLGYANPNVVITPSTVGPVDLGRDGTGRLLTATAISAGENHTCALLDDGSVRCWGYGADGELGYARTDNVGDDEPPGSMAPVDLGARHTAVAISAGGSHTCAVLDDASVRCWGLGASGRLGYGNIRNIGDNETPGSAGPVNVGSGGAVAISAGFAHTCARLGDGGVRCWGAAGNGRLGSCSPDAIGDSETPDAAGPVDLGEPSGGAGCASPGPPSATPVPPAAGSTGGATPSPPPSAGPAPSASPVPIVASDAARARGLRRCLAAVAAHAGRERKAARRARARQRPRARNHLIEHSHTGRRRCMRRFGRTPGHVTGLHAHAVGKTKIKLDFKAAGTDRGHAPAAQGYLIKQALRPIRTRHGFARAQPLCDGSCRFTVSAVGGRISLTVGELQRGTTYYYAVAARDNVSGRRGPRSPTVKARTG